MITVGDSATCLSWNKKYTFRRDTPSAWHSLDRVVYGGLQESMEVS